MRLGTIIGILIPSVAAYAGDTVDADRETAHAVERHVMRLAQEIAPCVVSIEVRRGPLSIPVEMEAMAPILPIPVLPGRGTGVFVDTEGHILTNEHVIREAERISVTLSNGEELGAQLCGADRRSDLAVIQIKSKNPIKPAIFGDSRSLKTGQTVFAFGNPRGFSGSLTQGVISAVNRNLPVDHEPGAFYFGMIQTDVALNPGSSGGPLVDLDGRVIGITALLVTSGRPGMGSEGLGFAVPAHLIQRHLNNLCRGGPPSHGWVGVQWKSLDGLRREAFEISEGLFIDRVVPGSPAEKAGLQSGMILLRVGKTSASSVGAVMLEVDLAKPGDTIIFRVRLADKTEKDISVTIGTRTEGKALIEKIKPVDKPAPPKSGKS